MPPEPVFADVPTLEHIPQWSPERGIFDSRPPTIQAPPLALKEVRLNVQSSTAQLDQLSSTKPSLFSSLHQDLSGVKALQGCIDEQLVAAVNAPLQLLDMTIIEPERASEASLRLISTSADEQQLHVVDGDMDFDAKIEAPLKALLSDQKLGSQSRP